MAPDEVLSKHTSYQLTEWMAFYKLEAIDQEQQSAKDKLEALNAARRRGRR